MPLGAVEGYLTASRNGFAVIAIHSDQEAFRLKRCEFVFFLEVIGIKFNTVLTVVLSL